MSLSTQAILSTHHPSSSTSCVAPHFSHTLTSTAQLQEQSDVDRALAGLSIYQDILAQPSLAPYNLDSTFAGVPAFLTGKALLDAITSAGLIRATHAIGTASLGSVVDRNLKLIGSTNIFVCDASVHPTNIRGHPISVTYAIGERCAGFASA